ncbi:hypothetical protein BaRGS_00040086 [Batillaria attramentaria]|uniref:Sushi, von Willebrand factor type A, EGF and pentraxin domain-containing protein 1-like n=1 Tax=Batillaria attramentaria TaxID=370345 RepID=A0ABD0J188_9CAEN
MIVSGVLVVSCQDPPHLHNGDWYCPDGKEYQSTCMPKCHQGFTVRDAVPIHCLTSGKWSSVFSQCTDAEPPELPGGCPSNIVGFSGPKATPASITWTDPAVSDNSGAENVTFFYRPGKGSAFPLGKHEHEYAPYWQLRPTARYFARTPILKDPSANSEISCGLPTPVNHGVFTCDAGTNFQDICTLKCLDGFTLENQATIECSPDGTWTQPGTCRDVGRPVFPNGCPSNILEFAARLGESTRVNWADPEVEDNSGSPVQLVSDAKSEQEFPLGVTTVTYTATDPSGNKGSCNFTVTVETLNCGAPDFEDGGRTPSVMLYDCPNGTVLGATCGLSCMQGYPMRGETTITCERDDSTYPPTMVWQWPGADLAMKPTCADVICPNLTAPQNGALSCYLGNHGYDCYMSCNENWDVPGKVPDGGRYTCTNSRQTWIPPTMVDCIARYRPNRARVHADVFYYTGDCNTSIEDIKNAFIERITTSEFADACTNVPSCIADNVEVKCGEVSPGRRRRRSADYFVSIEFDILMEYDEDIPDALQTYTETKDNIIARLNEEAGQGHFDFEGLTADEYSVAGSLDCECPAGSACSQNPATQRFACKRCSTGYFMPEGETECFECPVGTYQDKEIATNCTQCPPGMSTASTGSESFQECKELCKPGYVSSSGFIPCHPCAPGSYQSSEGQKSCQRCPLGTSTQNDKASSRLQCLLADFHPTNTNASYDFSLTDKASLASWIFIPYHLSTLNIKAFAKMVDFELLLQRENSTVLYGSTAIPVSLGDLVRPGAWFHLAVTNDNTASSSSIYINGKLLPGLPFNMSEIQQVIGEVHGAVVLSGLLAVDRVLSPDEVKEAAKTCTVDVDQNHLINVTLMPAATTPSVCDAVDDCASFPCGVHPCENQLGGYTCHCQDGWTGDQCQTPPNHCLQVQCMNNATCVSTETNFTCICPHGYTGRLCQAKIVAGGWGDWTIWSECTQTCGGGQQNRHRLCNNPQPQAGGQDCVGENNQTQNCGMVDCPVSGGWGEWAEWSVCSKSCRGGGRTRQRACDSPSPMHGGLECLGEQNQTEFCNVQVCPGDGDWGLWSEWTQCSASCNGGVQSRHRLCDNPSPSDGGNPCAGDTNVTQTCNDFECPECPRFPRPANAYPPQITQNGTDKECTVSCLPGYGMGLGYAQHFYCGPGTDFTWSLLPSVNVSYSEPVCTAQHEAKGAQIQASVVMEIDCQDEGDAHAEEVRKEIQEKLIRALPCSSLDDPICNVETTVTCTAQNTTRKRRSADATEQKRVVVVALVSGDVPASTASASTQTDYAKLVEMAEETAELLQNDTESLFTVNVGGETIRPDMSTISYSGGYRCPAGTVDCPPGSYSKGNNCVLCPMGQYQDEIASTACKPCPPGFSWHSVGASRLDQCVFPHQKPAPSMPSAEGSESTVAIVGISVGVSVAVVAVAVVALAFIWYKSKGLKWKHAGSNSMLSLNKIHPDTCTPRQCY